MVKSFLDDDIIGGSAESVMSDFLTPRQRSQLLGLDFNLAKCEVAVIGSIIAKKSAVQARFSAAFPELQFPFANNLSYLGSP